MITKEDKLLMKNFKNYRNQKTTVLGNRFGNFLIRTGNEEE